MVVDGCKKLLLVETGEDTLIAGSAHQQMARFAMGVAGQVRKIGSAQLDAVRPLQPLVKLPLVQGRMLVAIETQHFLGRLQRRALRTGLPPAPIKQPVVTIRLVALFPPAHLPAGGTMTSAACQNVIFIARFQKDSGYPRILPPYQERLIPSPPSADTSPAN